MIIYIFLLKSESILTLILPMLTLFIIFIIILKVWAYFGDKRDERKKDKVKIQSIITNNAHSNIYNKYAQYSITKKDFSTAKLSSSFSKDVEQIIFEIYKQIGIKRKEIEQYDAKNRSMFPEDLHQYISDADLLDMKDGAQDEIKQLFRDIEYLKNIVKIYKK
jgi:hypothetical protein